MVVWMNGPHAKTALSHTFILMTVKARTNCSSRICFLTHWYISFAMICNQDKSERGKCFSTNSIYGIRTKCSDVTRWKWVMSLFLYGTPTFQNFVFTIATSEQYTEIIQFVSLSFFYNLVARVFSSALSLEHCVIVRSRRVQKPPFNGDFGL